NQAADRRARLRRHLDEIEPLLVCDPKRGVQGKHAQLIVLVVDQSHFGATDLIVDPQLFKRYGTLPRPNSVLLYSSIHIKQNGQHTGRPLGKPVWLNLRVRTGALLQSVDGTG